MPAVLPVSMFSLIRFAETPPFSEIPALLLPEMTFSLKTLPTGVSTRMMPFALSDSVFSRTTFCVELRPPHNGIWVVDLWRGEERPVYRTSTGSVMPLGWSADARAIYAIEGKPLNFRGLITRAGETVTDARILRVPVNGDAATTVVALPFEEIGGVSMSADGRRFVCAVYSSQSDVWVVDNFDGTAVPRPH